MPNRGHPISRTAVGGWSSLDTSVRGTAGWTLKVRMGDYAARWYLDGLGEMVDHPMTPTRTVQQVTGRPATTFAACARKHAAAFR